MSVIDAFNLKGKTAFITGGSEGIGKAIALALAEAGAALVINYFNDHDKANETLREIEHMGAECHLFCLDIAEPQMPQRVKKFLDDSQLSIDILILNASVQLRNTLENISAEEFDMQVNTNFKATLFLIQALYPEMKRKGWGRILTIGSIQQVRPHEHLITYAATKSAQMNLVKNLAAQVASSGVTINNLAPGAIATKRNYEVLQNAGYKKLVESKIPLGFVGESSDCAPMALLLCSQAGRYITGQDIFVDGGMSLLT